MAHALLTLTLFIKTVRQARERTTQTQTQTQTQTHYPSRGSRGSAQLGHNVLFRPISDRCARGVVPVSGRTYEERQTPDFFFMQRVSVFGVWHTFSPSGSLSDLHQTIQHIKIDRKRLRAKAPRRGEIMATK
jgi:hypothetical protein